MTEDEKEKCSIIISKAAATVGSAGAGLSQAPFADSALIVPMQIAMIVELGSVFDQHVTGVQAKGIALGMAGRMTGRVASQHLVGWIPGVGNAVNSATAITITEAMGWEIALKFAKGEINSRDIEGFRDNAEVLETGEREMAVPEEVAKLFSTEVLPLIESIEQNLTGAKRAIERIEARLEDESL